MSIIRAVIWFSLAAVAGCAGYRWSSSVPEEMRRIYVPTFVNESSIDELGSVMTRQVARELQRDGTYRLAHQDAAAVEILGTVLKTKVSTSAGDYRSGARHYEYQLSAKVKISVIDKVNHKVLIDNREYTAMAFFVGGEDLRTAQRDASGRLAEDLARQVVDELLGYSWQ